jgi:ribosomal protein S18 acetylase RimI-like enzyme
VHAARNEVFMDHWGSQPVTDEMWGSFVGAEVFRADLSFVALAAVPGGDEEIAGFVMSTVNEDDWKNQGFTGSYIDLVGVRKRWRGQHIAQALLAAQFEAGRALGHERTTLDVDADSPTGALGLYTGMGFHPTQRNRAYTLEF